MSSLGGSFDRGKESVISRDDFNRLFSNARAVRDASAKLVAHLISAFSITLKMMHWDKLTASFFTIFYIILIFTNYFTFLLVC